MNRKHSAPPPDEVTWQDIAAAVAAAGPTEIIVGAGKRKRLGALREGFDSLTLGPSPVLARLRQEAQEGAERARATREEAEGN